MKKKKINVDKVLLYLCFSVLAIVLISQIGLKIPSVKGVFTDIEVFEGKAINEDGNVVNSGIVTLKMLNGSPCNEYEIFVNGEKVDVFDTQVKRIELLSTSVIEILSKTNENAFVQISDMTNNLKLVTVNEEIQINTGINTLGRIILKS